MNPDKIIQRASFEMFRDWTKFASEKYPNLDFTIVDETELFKDACNSFNNACESLFSSKYDEKRKDENWCVGFVEGYLKGSINRQWFHEYFQKQSDNYKNMIALKSVLEFSKVDSDLSWRLDALYKQFFKSINLEQIELRTKVDANFLEKFDIPPTNRTGIVFQLFENLVVKFIKDMTDEKSFDFPQIDEKQYISTEEMLFLIENWQKQ